MGYKVSVFSIWRDSAEHVHRTLKQLEGLESLDGFNFSFYFYENDSVDNTPAVLAGWLQNRNGGLLSEELNSPKFGSVTDIARMKLLCDCRNKSKSLAGENDSDYSLIFDSDIQFNNYNFIQLLNTMHAQKNSVMVTSNCRQNIPDYVFGLTDDSYYDVYPFRDRRGNAGLYFSDCPSYLRDDQFNWKLGRPIRCLSAFGGFALLKSEAFNQVQWSADLHCDHVNMCFDLQQFGSIYIDPRSCVYTDVGIDKINVDACKTIAKDQFNKYNTFF